MYESNSKNSYCRMKPVFTLSIATVVAALVLLIPYVGFWFLPIVLPAVVGIMVIHQGVSGTRPLRDVVRSTLIASIALTLFAFLQGLNVQRCLDIGMAEKGVRASEVASCRVFGMYNFPGYSSGRFGDWPASGLGLVVLPTAILVLLISAVYLFKVRIWKTRHEKDAKKDMAVTASALVLLVSIAALLLYYYQIGALGA